MQVSRFTRPQDRRGDHRPQRRRITWRRALKDKDGGFRPLVYCWRGGQRSGAMATILAQVGWRTAVLAGGYKTYRALGAAAAL